MLGDWSWLVRDWADLIRAAYLGGAVFAFVNRDYGDGARLLVTLAVAVAARLLNTPRPFDFLFSLTIGLQAWGNLTGLFHKGNLFDRIDHASSIFGLVPLFYLWFVHLELVQHTSERQSRSRHVGLVVIGACVGMAIGACYEIYEYIAVHELGSKLFISESDTVFDLAMDGVGAIAGGLLLLAWVMWGWGTERRVSRPLSLSRR